MSKKFELITVTAPHHRQKYTKISKQVFRLSKRTVACRKVLDMAQAYDAVAKHPYSNTPCLYYLTINFDFCLRNIGNRV
jgi:hypothetical protein